MNNVSGGTISSPAQIPGYLLMAMSALWGILMLVMTMLSAAGLAHGQGVHMNLGTPFDSVINLFIAFVLCLYYLAIAGGAFSMARGGNRTVAWMTAIAATIPCCSPWVCLGMLPGIWCMVALSRTPSR